MGTGAIVGAAGMDPMGTPQDGAMGAPQEGPTDIGAPQLGDAKVSKPPLQDMHGSHERQGSQLISGSQPHIPPVPSEAERMGYLR